MSKYSDADFLVRAALDQKDRRSDTNVYIANLPLSFTDRDLELLAKDYGLIITSMLLRDYEHAVHVSRYGTYVGLVDYSSNAEAARAVSMLHGKKLNSNADSKDRPLACCFAERVGPCSFPEKSKIIIIAFVIIIVSIIIIIIIIEARFKKA